MSTKKIVLFDLKMIKQMLKLTAMGKTERLRGMTFEDVLNEIEKWSVSYL